MIRRYTLPAMGAIWAEEARFGRWLAVELAVCRAFARRGKIPRASLRNIERRAGFSVARIDHHEKRTQHDVLAFLASVGERVGRDARFIHMGLTSYDVVDTALSMALRDSTVVLEAALSGYAARLRRLAAVHRETVTVARTHGVHAEPTSLGLKFALHYAEAERNLVRLRRARATVAVGKISGAVGNYAHLPPAIEAEVLRGLKLAVAPVSTQVLQRDRHAEYLATLAIIAGSLEQFATEVRNLQRTEIREMEEPFAAGQKGSSAMPHKRNPILSERICGLAREVRAQAMVGFENIALWHERDLTNSSAERVALPDATILVDYMLSLCNRVLDGLRIDTVRMRENLDRTGGLIYSQRVLLALVGAGATRDAAYRLVQAHAMASWEGGRPFREALAGDDEVRRRLPAARLEECFDPRYYLRNVDAVYRRLRIPRKAARA